MIRRDAVARIIKIELLVLLIGAMFFLGYKIYRTYINQKLSEINSEESLSEKENINNIESVAEEESTPKTDAPTQSTQEGSKDGDSQDKNTPPPKDETTIDFPEPENPTIY